MKGVQQLKRRTCAPALTARARTPALVPKKSVRGLSLCASAARGTAKRNVNQAAKADDRAVREAPGSSIKWAILQSPLLTSLFACGGLALVLVTPSLARMLSNFING